MKVLESAKKLYLVGYNDGKPTVVWFNVKNFKNKKLKGKTALTFSEDGIKYSYISSKDGYVEASNSAPSFSEYKLMDEDEFSASGIEDKFSDVDLEDVFSILNDKDNDDDDEDTSYHPTYGCGYYGGCGYGYGGGCGGGFGHC